MSLCGHTAGKEVTAIVPRLIISVKSFCRPFKLCAPDISSEDGTGEGDVRVTRRSPSCVVFQVSPSRPWYTSTGQLRGGVVKNSTDKTDVRWWSADIRWEGCGSLVAYREPQGKAGKKEGYNSGVSINSYKQTNKYTSICCQLTPQQFNLQRLAVSA